MAGCRVLDLGIITAGAATSALLADLGAEVIKLESRSYRDPFRVWTSPMPKEARGLAPFFRFTNRGKRGISLDLKQEAGRAAFLRLAARSDVVVENFRRGVLDRLGIGYAALKSVNDRIILASISSQGETGPMADYVSFGSTLEAVAGLASITGYAGGAPVLSGKEVNLPDQNVAVFAASMVATAWLARQRGGGGAHLDLAQRELTSFMVGEAFAAESPALRSGNAQAPYALQECVRMRDASWLAVSVMPDQLAVFDRLIGRGSEADRISALERWSAARPVADGVAALAAAGIAAAPALNGEGMLAARDRLWSRAIESHTDYGLLKGFPFQLDGAPLRIETDAPEIGADTAAVLAEVGGYAPEEIAALCATGVAERAPA